MPGRAETEQGRRLPEPLGQVRQRRDADPAADEQRALDVEVEAVAERAEDADLVAAREPGERGRPRADGLEQEGELSWRCEAERHRPRQQPARRLEHEELTREARLERSAPEPQKNVRAPTELPIATTRSRLPARSAGQVELTERQSTWRTDALLEGQRALGTRVRDRVYRCGGARDGRDAGNARDERGFADQVAVRAGSRALRRVDDEVAAPAADEVDDRLLARRGVGDLRHLAHLEPRRPQRPTRSVGGHELEAEPGERGRDRHDARLVGVADGEEGGACGRKRPAGGSLRLGEGGRQVACAGHHLACRAHLGPEHGVRAGEAGKRQHRRLHAHLRGPRRRQSELAQCLAGREAAGRLDEVDSDRLARERHRARRARVRLEHVDGRVGDRQLDVEQADDAERRPEALDDVLDLQRIRERERLRRQHAGRVAGMNPGFLDVLHDGGDVDVRAVAERVDVDLDRVLDEPVEQDGAGHGRHRGTKGVVVVTDPHRPPAEHVGGPHQHRIADLAGGRERLLLPRDGRPRRAADTDLACQRPEALAVLGEVDRGVRRAHDPVPGALDPARQPERRLAAELRHDPDGLLPVEHREHLLGGERLEVEAVRGVVVGRDRLRVAIDHHRLVAQPPERLDGVDAAVVELDPLPDPVRARAEDDHPRACRVGKRLVLLAPGGVVVVRGSLDLARARVDASVRGDEALLPAQLAHALAAQAERSADRVVAPAGALGPEQVAGAQLLQCMSQLLLEPGVHSVRHLMRDSATEWANPGRARGSQRPSGTPR